MNYYLLVTNGQTKTRKKDNHDSTTGNNVIMAHNILVVVVHNLGIVIKSIHPSSQRSLFRGTHTQSWQDLSLLVLLLSSECVVNGVGKKALWPYIAGSTQKKKNKTMELLLGGGTIAVSGCSVSPFLNLSKTERDCCVPVCWKQAKYETLWHCCVKGSRSHHFFVCFSTLLLFWIAIYMSQFVVENHHHGW